MGLVLSGGGARGAFQVGVWEVLCEDPRGFRRTPDVISGTSAGALNGAFIAAGLTPREMLDFWLSLSDDPPIIANETFFSSLQGGLQSLLLREPFRRPQRRLREVKLMLRQFRKHAWYKPSGVFAMFLELMMTARFDSISRLLDSIKTAYLFDTTPVRERLQAVLGATYIEPKDVKLAINTVDIRTGGVVRIVNAPPTKSQQASAHHYRVEPKISLDMILASASIPLLFNPVRVGELDLWDGGLLVNTPLAPAVALGAEKIVPVLVTLRESHAPDKVLDSMGSAIERLADAFLENAYNIDRKLLLERNKLAQLVPELNLIDVELFRAIRPAPDYIFNAGSYLFFERDALLAMYQAGRRAARRWLNHGPLLDSREFDN